MNSKWKTESLEISIFGNQEFSLEILNQQLKTPLKIHEISDARNA